jgi:tRNA A-37 threonylcarbamoyl transferase component Bud32
MESEALSPSHGVDDGETAQQNRTIPHGSMMEFLKSLFGEVPSILLRDTQTGLESPMVRPSSPEMPENQGRYQLLGEIDHGGMGAVLKGRDPALGRDLAIKVLLEKYRHDPEITRRFVEEAQICAQLQHPGIVPVHELGSFDDGRPYFTMKLVKGRNLAVLLKERADPAHDLPQFLGIFEQVCQAMAYAHVRGVIHRDLKPSNVMVGAFGEVQVMDWGLAKVLPQGGTADESRPQPDGAAISVIRTVRTGSGADESRAGSVLGTPAYMAPEQASGDVESIDERADVFGLGSILCEILTGQPAYTGPSSNAILRKAMRGETADALRRLDGSAADADLIRRARACLAVELHERPRDAGEIARRLTAYLAGVQERLQAAELARAAEAARAQEAEATAAAAEQARAAEEARAEEEARGRVLADRLAREAEARAKAERNRRRMTPPSGDRVAQSRGCLLVPRPREKARPRAPTGFAGSGVLQGRS